MKAASTHELIEKLQAYEKENGIVKEKHAFSLTFLHFGRHLKMILPKKRRFLL